MIKILLFNVLSNFFYVNANLLYPPSENIAVFKPLKLIPSGSTCGNELKDTLCDNRIQNSRNQCSNRSSIFYCDQTCPYGNVLENLDKLKQLNLESMNPCAIVQDFNKLLTRNNPTSQFSYYFDKSNNLCKRNRNGGPGLVLWRPFGLQSNYLQPSLSFYNFRTPSLSILNSGFTMTLWIKQLSQNNGLEIIIKYLLLLTKAKIF